MSENKKKILVVEDDRYIRKLYLLKLRKEGYNVEFSVDVASAIDKFVLYKPDLVILDILLPDVEGFAFLEEIKQRKRSSVPVIVLSNLSQPENVKKALAMGASEYLVKVETEVTELVEKINKILK